jgi:BirA family biotin operon repressor/biotin-[acetyl-CoA-carboxylase] ligase
VNQPACGATHGPWRLTVFETLPSTSDLCCERARAGEPDGLAVLAHRQDKARGRAGRAWTSPEGNLFLSAVLRPGSPARDAGLWSLLAGVALAEALAAYLPDAARLALKWPNDVLLDGGKLAGILIDSATTPSGDLDWMVIGIGANLAIAPNLPDRATACLADHGPTPSPETAARAILARLDHWRARFAAEGFAPVRAAWLGHAQSLGTHMTVKLPERQWTGTFVGLGEDGSLRLHSEGLVRHFAAGEIVQDATSRKAEG